MLELLSCIVHNILASACQIYIQKLTHTTAFKATAFISLITGAIVVSHSVGAGGIPITVVKTQCAFIDICARETEVVVSKYYCEHNALIGHVC